MVEATGNLARSLLRHSEFECYIVRRARERHDTRDTLWQFKTKVEGCTPFEDDFPVLIVVPKSLGYEQSTVESRQRIREKFRGLLITFLLKVGTSTDKKDNEKSEMRTLSALVPV